MPKIQIDGVGTVNVDDSFLKLSPADQNATVDEIIAYAQANAGSAKPARKMAKIEVEGVGRFEVDDAFLTASPEVQQATMQAMAASARKTPASHANVRTDLQRMFDGGASAQDLRAYAQQNGGYNLNGLDEAISFRDKGGKGAIVAPVQEAPPAANDQFPAGYFEQQEADYQKAKTTEDARLAALYAPRDNQPQEGGPGFATRQLSALNEGIADTLGAPVDIINAGMGAIGLPVSDKPFLGSESIRDGLHAIGIGQTDEGYAPRSALEKYTQAASRGVGQAVVPAGGLPALGGRAALLAKATAPVATRAESLLAKVGQAAKEGGRTLVTEAAKRPGLAVSAELGSGAGSGVGGQTARDVAPGNPYAEFVGTMIGGVAAGLPVGAQVQKGLTPSARFANVHADNPFLGVDTAIANDVERIVSSVPRHDASGRKVPAMARAATLRNRVDQLARSYLPNVQTINALNIPPSQKRLLRNALDGALTLSPDDIDALRITPHGNEAADAIVKAQRLRHYIPEGSAPTPDRSLAGLVADTAGVAIGSKIAGPAGAAAYRVGREAIASKLPGGAKDAAVDIKALAGRASAFRKLAETQGITIPQSTGRPLEKAANEAQDGVYLARQASKARKAREAAEALDLHQGNRRIGIKNDLDNVKPQGGYRGYIYDRTGLLPAAQDAGAMRMVADGTMTPQQLEAFLSDPAKLQTGNAGNAILDRLASMADEGHLGRDPSWSPPSQSPALSEAMDSTGQPIRNPLAYQAAAKGNQDRVTAALNGVWNNSDLDEPVKRTIGSAVSKLGTTSSRADAESLLSSVIDELPQAHRDYGRTILQPLVSAIKAPAR